MEETQKPRKKNLLKATERNRFIANALLSLSPGDKSCVRRYFCQITPNEADKTNLIVVNKVIENTSWAIKQESEDVCFTRGHKGRDIWRCLRLAEANNHFKTSENCFLDTIKKKDSPKVMANMERLSLMQDMDSNEFCTLLRETLSIIGPVNLGDLIGFISHWNKGGAYDVEWTMLPPVGSIEQNDYQCFLEKKIIMPGNRLKVAYEIALQREDK